MVAILLRRWGPLWAALLLCLGTPPSYAAEIHLRPDLSQADASAVPAGQPHDRDWTWLQLNDPSRLKDLPANWHLLIDQVRFAEIRTVITTIDGREIVLARRGNDLGQNWAAGAVLKFEIAPAGQQIRSLAIGFRGLDDLALMRKVTAASADRSAVLEGRWLILMGIYVGLLASALAYNLLVHFGQRSSFQRFYLGWVTVALAYGLSWSNLGAYAFPGLAGPLAVRLNNGLVGMLIALAALFLISVLESRTVPRRLVLLVRFWACAAVVAGILAIDERLVPASVSDLLLNLAMIASVGTSMAVISVAAWRGSRVVWIYMVGWTPVIAVFALRAARNFGLTGQNDWVDMATFGSIGLEAMVFSFAIASRFIALRKERDAAEASARGMEIERETLQRAAHSDFLTGLGNRALFHAQLRELFGRRASFTLMLIDVDYLKEINDRQGHDAGDVLLRHIGERLGTMSSDQVSCARIGGDEFAILCEDELGARLLVIDALDRMQGATWSHGSFQGSLSLSIGTASSLGASAATDLFQQADIALYEAKRLGRGRRLEFDGRLRLQTENRVDLIREATAGLDRSEFALHFQPIVHLGTGTLVSVEALLRWNHPQRGMLTPDSFGGVMEDGDCGSAVQKRVIDLAIDELSRRVPGSQVALAVNFTAMDLRGRESAEQLLTKLHEAGVSPGSLCIEVTEGTILAKAVNDPTAALRVLHEAGVQIALDDFGTGYASLVHLKEIPVDILKIDRSFISGLLDDGESEEIVRAVIALGHGLKKRVVAEGIETRAQMERLRELGCVYGQGYLFAHPSAEFDPALSCRPASAA
ncbi:EAL domain-containing protein [Croceibacterium sp. LX-88]|uniref:EAL domain-containing protein n=1 Tax=Croceibacterium selenioxidans TaxID=2838833 RepID=A0ABS5W551_9SPHN|nr:EAL domain-containing protein [Croceibacterium selenioxidans]MBT2134882.1 EAL domain-containing protein [Croceibacterium selenioxidans]